MGKPFSRGDGVQLHGVEMLLCVVDVSPNYTLDCWIVTAEDIHGQAKISAKAEHFNYIEIGQLDLFGNPNDE